jgi:hypothetical protein
VIPGANTTQKALGLPHGAIVIGLGKWGELSSAQLGNLIRVAALHYLLRLDDCRSDQMNGEDSAEVGLSILLIGANSTSNITTGDSVGAILRGIGQANRELQARADDAKRITEIEIVELYADTAIEAAHALNRLAKFTGDELETQIDAGPLLRRGGAGRTRLTGFSTRRPWLRWEISATWPGENMLKPTIPAALAERLKRAIAETKDPDPDFLGVLTEVALGAATDDAGRHREIPFLSLSDCARAEVITQQRRYGS